MVGRYPAGCGSSLRCDARSQGGGSVHGQVRGAPGVRQSPAAAHVSRRRQGPARDAGEPLAVARGRDRGSPGEPGRQDAAGRRGGPGGHALAAARPRRRGARPSPATRPAESAGSGRPADPRDDQRHRHVARVCRPGSKLATTRWWTDTTLAADLGLTEVSTDEAYAAMDWLLERQDAIEAALADRHLSAPVNPDRLALFD